MTYDWLVIHGGHGLSKKYLEQGLKGVFPNYKLHYYDQFGSPESVIDHIPSIEEMVQQVFTVAAEKKLENFGLITHSFGNYIAVRALQTKNHNISGVIMISPMPFIFQHWQEALQKNSC
jgi:pimeloyl-ACP methyl ester carboxylesterase